jgi:hypothetical protein
MNDFSEGKTNVEIGYLLLIETKMTSFRGQASWAKMTSPGGKLTTLACHPTKGVNKAEEPAYLYKHWPMQAYRQQKLPK